MSKDFISRGLPEGISDIRHVLWMQLETQEHLVDIQRKSLEILGEQDTYKNQFEKQGERLIWDVNEARWVNAKGAALLEEGKKINWKSYKGSSVSKRTSRKDYIYKRLIKSSIV